MDTTSWEFKGRSLGSGESLGSRESSSRDYEASQTSVDFPDFPTQTNMAETHANKPKKPKDKATPPEPKTVAEAKELEKVPPYWQLTDDEVLLRSPAPEDEFKTSDSWRVFRILGEFVGGFDDLATITRGVSIFGSARTQRDDPMYAAAKETAKLLANAGFEIITGGGPGVMEAANQGAFEEGKVSVG